MNIRWMIKRDLGHVQKIQINSVGDITDPSDLLSLLRKTTIIGSVAELNEVVVGYAIYDLGRQYIDIRHLRVHEQFAGQGVGRALVENMARRIVGKRKALRVYVEDENLDAHLFLRACGFLAVQVVKGSEGEGDCYRFELDKERLFIEQ